MKILACFFCFYLLACSHNPNVQYREVPYTVEKIVYCAKDIPIVQYETSKLKRENSVESKVRSLLIERQQRIIIEAQLRAELTGCQKQ